MSRRTHPVRDYANFFKPAAATEAEAELIAGAEACLESFTAALNAKDLLAMDVHLHFPHVMVSGAELVVWPGAGQLPLNFFDELVKTGWAKTVYEKKLPIMVSADKVHFHVCYTRRAAGGEVLTEHDNVWIVTRIAGRWGIAVRSY